MGRQIMGMGDASPVCLYEDRFSWAEFLDKVVNGKDICAEENPEYYKSSSQTNEAHESWDKSVGYQGAIKLAYQGWNEGLAYIEPLIANVLPNVGSRMERVNWKHDVEPAQLDIARYLEGEPECWL